MRATGRSTEIESAFYAGPYAVRWNASTVVIVLAALMWTCSSWAQSVSQTALPPDHPLIGSWRLDLPKFNCFEIYDVREDGTTYVTSGAEVSESEFELSVTPSEQGYYKWVDKITKDNGKPDCAGGITELGHVATNFVLLHPSGEQFFMCQAEEIKHCIGPFVRQKGI